MEIKAILSNDIRSKILHASKIVIISHRNPDADTIGSNLALRLVFERWGKQVTSACIDPVDPVCLFLPNAETYKQNFDFRHFDLLITVDAGSIAQAAFPATEPEMLKGDPPLVNIDHHPSNNHYGTTNLVIDNAASTTLIIFHLLKSWAEPITPDIATCLLIGLYYDTGSFMHSNTDAEVLETAAQLMQLGARKNTIITHLFKQHPVEKLKLWGKILSNIQITDNDVVVGAVKKEDMDECQADINQLSGLIDYLSMAKNSRFATLLTEDGNGHIRGSLRTKRNDIDLSEVASSLGGGGHKKASGFTLPGRIKQELRWTIEADET
jgi:bifunctional oligoribonuclease and PAP phosphatase NrnA